MIEQNLFELTEEQINTSQMMYDGKDEILHFHMEKK